MICNDMVYSFSFANSRKHPRNAFSPTPPFYSLVTTYGVNKFTLMQSSLWQLGKSHEAKKGLFWLLKKRHERLQSASCSIASK